MEVKWKARNPLILVFHGVVSNDPLKYNSRHIQIEYFTRIINFLEENGQIISLQSALAGNYNQQEKNFVLTFDDGYLSNFKNVIPYLKQHNIPASFCYNNVNSESMLWPDLLDLSIDVKSDFIIDFSGEKLNLKSDIDKIRKIFFKAGKDAHEDLRTQLNPIEKEIKHIPKTEEFWKRMSLEQLKEIHSNELFELVPHGQQHVSYRETPDSFWKMDFKTQYELHIQEFGETNSFAFPFAFWKEENISYLHEHYGIDNFLVVDQSKFKYKKVNILPRFNVHQHLNFDIFKHFIARGNFE